jgi:hypothetical protein
MLRVGAAADHHRDHHCGGGGYASAWRAITDFQHVLTISQDENLRKHAEEAIRILESTE